MSEYPEHIDQIDDYYRSQLADHEIEPPAGLWDKISLTALDTPAPEANAAAFRLTSAQKYLGSLAGIIILVVGAYYFYASKQESTMDEDNAPVIEQPLEQNQNNTSPENHGENENLKEVTPNSSNKIKNSTNASDSLHQKTEESTSNSEVIENKTEDLPILTPAVTEEHKADSIADIKTTQKAPKEKVKFKDKYKKDYQDSTRKLFVPGK